MWWKTYEKKFDKSVESVLKHFYHCFFFARCAYLRDEISQFKSQPYRLYYQFCLA